MTQPPSFDLHGTLSHDGPLTRTAALAALDHAAELMEQSRFVDAARLYQRVIGFDDRGVTAAALLGFGQAMHRLDDENAAVGAWQEVTRLPATPATYPAWRELAGARVRSGDLAGAADAYRAAERLAPREDKAEIASRLGWLSKELGDTRAAGRYFSRARGGSAMAMTLTIIAITTVISLVADIGGSDGSTLLHSLWLDKVLVAQGEVYRLFTVALVHAPLVQDPFHLPFNMYALWLVGPLVERLYGRWRFLAFYVVCTVWASLLSFALSTTPGEGGDQFAVGASGGIFGLFGLLVGTLAVQRPVLGSAMRGLLGQLVALIAINLLLGATMVGIDNWAHVGGLVTGLWFGVLLLPTGVPTLRSMWLRPGQVPGEAVPIVGRAGMVGVQIAGMVALAVAFWVLWGMGVQAWGAT
ncbi:MAG: rhomboid family intramembrane serine protease [Candidatus Limnocylindrales bacterium]